METDARTDEQPVQIPVGGVILDGDLTLPADPNGVCLFAHGSGSSRHSPRNRYVAGVLQQAGLATLLMDLLTDEEEQVDARTRELRFDINLLGERLVGATDWLAQRSETAGLAVGTFGASTGAAAALVAAAERPDAVGAVVSRGGRPDLAGDALARVKAPTLLIVGGNDPQVLELNEDARARMSAQTQLEVVEGATHLFEEPGALEQVAEMAMRWLTEHLGAQPR